MKRLALCIGNDNYEILNKLTCAVNDATEISHTLEALGIDTSLKINLSRDELGRAINDFLDKLANYDVGILYYAGHGFEVGGTNILAPIELNPNESERNVVYNAYPLNELMGQLEVFPDTTKIVILDACREILGSRGGLCSFTPVVAPSGSLIAFATSPGKKSFENVTSGHGKYTEALLKYIDIPRVPVETIFKKVREDIVAQTHGAQVPWEHTSLTGDFFFNPDIIYSGVNYSDDALADALYRFADDSPVKRIVSCLKSGDWNMQANFIAMMETIDYETVSANDLFILGRNIYQAADGRCYAAHNYIGYLEFKKSIPEQAKIHIMNGMAYEIYFDSYGNLRGKFKSGYYIDIIKNLEKAIFYPCKEFICSKLTKYDCDVVYYPGQSERIELEISMKREGSAQMLSEIVFRGVNIFKQITDKPDSVDIESYGTIERLQNEIAARLVAPIDMVRFSYSPDVCLSDEIYVPIPYVLKMRE